MPSNTAEKVNNISKKKRRRGKNGVLAARESATSLLLWTTVIPFVSYHVWSAFKTEVLNPLIQKFKREYLFEVTMDIGEREGGRWVRGKSSEWKAHVYDYLRSLCRSPECDTLVRDDALLREENTEYDEIEENHEVATGDNMAKERDFFSVTVPGEPTIPIKFLDGDSGARFFAVESVDDQNQRHSGYVYISRSTDNVFKLFLPPALVNAMNFLMTQVSKYFPGEGSKRHLVGPEKARRYMDGVTGRVQGLHPPSSRHLNHARNQGPSASNMFSLSFRCLQSQKHLLETFFQHAAQEMRLKSSKVSKIKSLCGNLPVVTCPPRPRSTIATEKGAGVVTLDISVKQFWADRPWYAARGLPYQRMFLLHGPPGNGKSSYLQALASEHNIPYYLVDLSNDIRPSRLERNFQRTLGERCIVVVEDADSQFSKRSSNGGRQQLDGRSGQGDEDEVAREEELTVSKFVQFIDGHKHNPNGRIICFTTNDTTTIPYELLELVDAQGGRIEFKNASTTILRHYWGMFFRSNETDQQRGWETFLANYDAIYRRMYHSARLHSVADMQGFCMKFRDKPLEAAQKKNIGAHFKRNDEEALKQLFDTYYHEGWPTFLRSYTRVYRPTGTEEWVHNEAELKNYFNVHANKPFDAALEKEIVTISSRSSEEYMVVGGEGPTVQRLDSLQLSERTNVPRHIASKILDDIGRENLVENPDLFHLAEQEAKLTAVNQGGCQTVHIRPISNRWLRLLVTVLVSTSLGTLVTILKQFTSVLKYFSISEGLLNSAVLVPAAYSFVAEAFNWWRHRLWKRFRVPLSDRSGGNCSATGLSVKNFLMRHIAKQSSEFKVDTHLVPKHNMVSKRYLESTPFCDNFPGKVGDVCVDLKANSKRALLLPDLNAYRSNIYLLEDQGIPPVVVTFDKRMLTLTLPRENAKKNMRIILEYAIRSECEHNKNYQMVRKFRRESCEWYTPAEKHTARIRLHTDAFIQPIDDGDLHHSLTGLAEDIKTFAASRAFYRGRGIPYRQGYLIAGPEQSGKDFLIRYLAGILGRDIHIIDLADSQNMSNTELSYAVQQCDGRHILVLENVDELVSASGLDAGRATGSVGYNEGFNPWHQQSSTLTYSGLLQVLDGPMANNQGLITILTTANYSRLIQDERSAAALLRPGRVGTTIRLGPPTKAQLLALFAMILESPDQGRALGEEFLHFLNDVETQFQAHANASVVTLEVEEHVHNGNTTETRLSSTSAVGEEDPEKRKQDLEIYMASVIQIDPDPGHVSPIWRSFLSWKDLQGLLQTIARSSRSNAVLPERKALQTFVQNCRSRRRQQYAQKIDKQNRRVLDALNIPTDLDENSSRQRAAYASDAKCILKQLLSVSTGLTSLKQMKEKHLSLYEKVHRLCGNLKKLDDGACITNTPSSMGVQQGGRPRRNGNRRRSVNRNG